MPVDSKYTGDVCSAGYLPNDLMSVAQNGLYDAAHSLQGV